MARASKGGPKKYPAHPTVAKLRPDPGKPATDAIRLVGYFGQSPGAGLLRLYPSLGDLSAHVDVRETDVVHHDKVPETLMEPGAYYVWLRRDAMVSYGRTQTAAETRFLQGPISAMSASSTLSACTEDDFPGSKDFLAAVPRALTHEGCRRTPDCPGMWLGLTIDQVLLPALRQIVHEEVSPLLPHRPPEPVKKAR